MRQIGSDFAQRCQQVVSHLGDILITVVGFFGKRAIQDILHSFNDGDFFIFDITARFHERAGFVIDDCAAHFFIRFTAKGPSARQHFVEQNAGRENIGAMIYFPANRLFGRGGGRRSVGRADFRNFGLMYVLRARVRIIQKFSQTEVQNLDLPAIVHHHVRRFDVAVNDAARVCGGERVA